MLEPKGTWRDAAKAWLANEHVWSVEMGGLGPGYEQCIQTIIFEILSRWEGKDPKWEIAEYTKEYPADFEAHAEKVIGELDKKFGFSGAQVGCGKNVAFQFMHHGYETMMNKAPEDRKIQVMRKFPSLD